MAPNYQAGKDMLAGFKRTFKGEVVDEVYTQINQPDFLPEIAQLQSDKPDAAFVFFPGGMGTNFVKQVSQAGLAGKLPLYSVFTVDGTTLPALGDTAVGSISGAMYDASTDTPENRKFVAAFEAKYKRTPSLIYAIAASALNLALGYGGLVSFGHALFMGLGSYAVALPAFHGIANGWAHLALCVGGSARVAWGVGAISLRTSGMAFIMITLAFAQMGYFLLISLKQYGGDDGLPVAATSQFGGVATCGRANRVRPNRSRPRKAAPDAVVAADRGPGQGYGALLVTDQVSLDIRAGELHAVIGPNGAGKTTLIDQLSGELAADAGRILFDGRDIGALLRSCQITSIFEEFTVTENAVLAALAAKRSAWRFWAPLLGDRVARAAEQQAVAAAGLAAHADLPAGELAYGQRRQLELGWGSGTAHDAASLQRHGRRLESWDRWIRARSAPTPVELQQPEREQQTRRVGHFGAGHPVASAPLGPASGGATTGSPASARSPLPGRCHCGRTGRAARCGPGSKEAGDPPGGSGLRCLAGSAAPPEIGGTARPSRAFADEPRP